MDNEKYGIELDLILGSFKKKIQEVKKDVNSVSKIKWTDEKGWRKASPQQWKDFLGETKNTNAEIVNTQKQYANLNTVSNKTNSNIGKGIEKMTSKIKRFGLSLLSIRSIYSLVSRASSAYLSQDTELANKLQSAWVGLGAMLAPIIEGIVNILAKAVKYINIFIKALTGVDLLARATAKSMNGTAKAAKGLNKALAGFDELNNLDTDAGGGTGALGLGGLADIDIDTKWADRIERFGNWVKKNKDTVISFFTALAGAILAVKLGMGGLVSIGVALFIYGVLKVVSELTAYLDKLDAALNNNGTTFKEFGEIVKYIGIAVLGLGVIIGSVTLGIVGAIILVVGVIIKYWNEIKAFLQKGIDWFTGIQDWLTNWFVSKLDWIGEHFGIVGQLIIGTVIQVFNWIIEIVKGAIDVVISVFDGLATGIKQIFDGILLIFKGDFKNGFINIGKGIVNIVIGLLNGLISAINAVAYPIRLLITEIGKAMGKNYTMSNIKIPKIPYLEIGTNYVPEDQLAMIHKGEAVIPKKFNSKEYFGGSDDETKSLLRELIDKVDGIEINPYTTIRDVGKASLSYINNKSRQLGESVVY